MRVLLDANLAVLLILGWVDRRLIGSHKRIQNYTGRDFDDLTAEVMRFEDIVVLPNTLTEISNLIAFGVDGRLRSAIFGKLRALIAVSEERYVQSSAASDRKEFERLGLTDAALLIAAQDCVLLTDDDKLYVAAVTAGHAVRNFRHIRAER